ncbi:MAG: 50S ribosomal protein L9 [Clostridia bacterium]|nr:50S ribosomal protein L9 [Clostridia bacterium]
MKVILTQDVKAQGKKGDVVTVSDGYATNFLFKNKLAVPANASNVNVNNMQKAAEAKRIADETAAAKEVAKKLEGVSLALAIEVGANGRAFGSISSKEISEGLEKIGFDIDKKKIELASPIKGEGSYKVPVRLYKGVMGQIKVDVSAVIKK